MKQRHSQKQNGEKLTLVCYNSASSNSGPRWHIFELGKSKVFGEELVWNPGAETAVCSSYDLEHIDGNNLGFEFDLEGLERCDLEEVVSGRLGELCERCLNRFSHRLGGRKS